jgi:SNF2 family DNA or RNA helicase
MKRIKVRSRGTLIICPLSTVSNWEDQFREHWGGGGVLVVGGSGLSVDEGGKEGKEKGTKKEKGTVKKEKEKEKMVDGKMEVIEWKKEEAEPSLPMGVSVTCMTGWDGSTSQSSTQPTRAPSPSLQASLASLSTSTPAPPDQKPVVDSKDNALKIYVYHGNARWPDPAFLADFDAVITTYATLASEYSKQLRSMDAEQPPGGTEGECDAETDGKGKKLCGMKRKKLCGVAGEENASPLQMVHWFRVVLDEAQ